MDRTITFLLPKEEDCLTEINHITKKQEDVKNILEKLAREHYVVSS